MTTTAQLSTDDTNDAAPAGIEDHATPEGRAAALLEALGQGDLAADSSAAYDTGDDDDDDAPAPPPRAAAKAPPAAAPPKAADPATDDTEPPPGEGTRAQRLEAARAKMRRDAEERRASQTLEAERAQLKAEREELARLRAEIEPVQAALKDPRLFIEMAKEHLPPEELAAAIPDMTSDETRAKWQHKRTASTLEEKFAAAVKAAVEPLQAKLQEFERRETEARAADVKRAFTSHVTTNADETPGFAGLVARNPERAINMAIEKAHELKLVGATAEDFALIAAAIEEEFYAGTQRAPASKSDTKTSAKRPAEAKANPLGNRATAERTGIKTDDGDDDDADGDSIQDRIRRAERSLRGKRISEAI